MCEMALLHVLQIVMAVQVLVFGIHGAKVVVVISLLLLLPPAEVQDKVVIAKVIVVTVSVGMDIVMPQPRPTLPYLPLLLHLVEQTKMHAPQIVNAAAIIVLIILANVFQLVPNVERFNKFAIMNA